MAQEETSHGRPDAVPDKYKPQREIDYPEDGPQFGSLPVIHDAREGVPGSLFLCFAVANVLEHVTKEEGREDGEYAWIFHLKRSTCECGLAVVVGVS